MYLHCMPYTVPFDKAVDDTCNGFGVHGFKLGDAVWNEGLHLVTVVDRVHHVEPVRQQKVEGEILSKGLWKVLCLDFLQGV